MLVEIGSGLGFFVVMGNGKKQVVKAKAKVDAPVITEVVAKADAKPALEAKAEAVPALDAPAPIPVANNDNEQSQKPAVPLISSNEMKDYYVDRIAMQDGTSITASALYEDYCAWAEARNKEPMTLPAFGRQFGEIGIQKAKIAGRIRYINIKLKAEEGLTEVPNTPARRAVAASA
jgi:hypothetical protein